MLLPTMKRLRRDRHGISNVIVVMLSLVLVVIIVSNVVLWSYQMNQFDLERMQEKVEINAVTRMDNSPWSTVQGEYTLTSGTRVNGSYVDTQAADGQYETFAGNTSGSPQPLGVVGAFTIDLNLIPVTYIQTLDVRLIYRANDSSHNWYLKAFNWTSGYYSDQGFNSTAGQQPTTGWDTYAVNLTDQWRSYLSGSGAIYVEVQDAQPGANQTFVDIDFLGVTAVVTQGATVSLQNKGSVTAHLVALWVDGPAIHQKYDINLILNAGDSINYTSADIDLADNAAVVKIVTERGNISVFRLA